MNPGNFFAELKRRNVFRAAAFYAASAWLLVQVATQVFPFFHIAEWVVRWIVVAAVIGFPPAMLFSWFYEWTSQGLQLESEIPPNESITRHTGRKLDFWIIGILAVTVVLLLANTFVLHQDSHGDPETAARVPPDKSIAVLPLENLSAEKENAYFSDGITEEILNALAQIPNLKVAARRSAFQFKGTNLDLRKVGQMLGVAHILEGSVQKVGDQVRINVQLVDAQNGLEAWSEKYDRKLDNVFAVEDEIARAIATRLRVQLTGGGGQPLVATGTSNSEAHELYLRGLTLLAARGPGLRDAADAFERAVQLDPAYAQAWGALAETDLLLPAYRLDSMDAALPRAASAAERALSLDPNTASAHVAIGIGDGFRCRWPEAEKAFLRALTLAPGDAEAVNQYAQFLSTVGQLEPALREIERAQRLDPLSPINGVIHAGSLLALHHDDLATAQVESVLSTHPDFAPAHAFAIFLYVDRKLYAKAEAHLRSLAQINGEKVEAKAALARGMGDSTQRAAAVQSLEAAPENADLRADPLWYAFYLISLGERGRALDQLEICAAKQNSSFLFFLWDRCFDPVRNDPRFKAVLAKLGLPYPASSAITPAVGEKETGS